MRSPSRNAPIDRASASVAVVIVVVVAAGLWHWISFKTEYRMPTISGLLLRSLILFV